MIYLSYEQLKQKYIELQTQYDAILTEKERLFEKTQPQAVNAEKERITGGNSSSPFDTYLITKEKKRIDERLEEVKKILDDRHELLKLKENELRSSKDWHDIIYSLYFIENLSITNIEFRLPYSRRQIYRIINSIKANLKTV